MPYIMKITANLAVPNGPQLHVQQGYPCPHGSGTGYRFCNITLKEGYCAPLRSLMMFYDSLKVNSIWSGELRNMRRSAWLRFIFRGLSREGFMSV